MTKRENTCFDFDSTFRVARIPKVMLLVSCVGNILAIRGINLYSQVYIL